MDFVELGIAGVALVVAIWSAVRGFRIEKRQERDQTVAWAREITVTLRGFDVDADPFVWGGPEDRDTMKDHLVTVQAFNDSDADVHDVWLELLVLTKGSWTLLGQRKLELLAAHTESPAVVGGALYYEPLPVAKGCARFVDSQGNKWVRWSDGRLIAAPRASTEEDE